MKTKKDLLKEYPELCKEIFIDGDQRYASVDLQSWDTYLKEQTKEDWTILEFVNTHDKSAKIILNRGIYVSNVTLNNYTLDEVLNDDYCVKSGDFEIRKVQKSNGEILTIGDRADLGIISGFRIGASNVMFVVFECGLDHPLNHITKLQPKFVTEDLQELYEGDEVWPMDISDFYISKTSEIINKDFSEHPRGKYFSTREAAEKWVKENKPTVSIAKLRELGISNEIIEKL